ncbi:AAA family ATPase [Bradyrhizobium sp. AUGA SZCCT0169]|uniref:ATP-binding protein n=1 Tax=Bradyrhizobium sp. AUGA SZCCT0169 TaxID=2807663 RepID=UPI001BA5013A|nr:ATP-binding protein [Bradyrhizobium sp. AUGA SZCCT0169]MBR1245985.1 AAA family ATPase [Bradyrhizobium sp. AUGA SZCCT0169]
MTSAILVFGVPGVGKTTACKSYVRRHPSFAYISASEVLREESDSSIEALRKSGVQDILRNQGILAHALASRMRYSQKNYFLIDSQNVIDNDVELIDVPIDVVRSLSPSGIILLESSAADIYLRRSNDIRSRPVRKIDQIDLHIQRTRRVTVDYATNLGVPMLIGLVTNGFEIDELVDKLLAGD